jgi:hypothetical protein
MQNKKNVRSLWRAVIMQAVVDASSRSKKRRAISMSKKAHEWFKKDDEFLKTCEMADVEPNYVQVKVDQYFKSR